ncbi:hypothetical protein GCM10027594_01370 [Hymenobacter agri]
MPTLKVSPTMPSCDALSWAAHTLEFTAEAHRAALAGVESGPAGDPRVLERATLAGQTWIASLGVGFLESEVRGLRGLLGRTGRYARRDVAAVLASSAFTLSPTAAAALARLPELAAELAVKNAKPESKPHVLTAATKRAREDAETVFARIATIPAQIAQVRAAVSAGAELKEARDLLV